MRQPQPKYSTNTYNFILIYTAHMCSFAHCTKLPKEKIQRKGQKYLQRFPWSYNTNLDINFQINIMDALLLFLLIKCLVYYHSLFKNNLISACSKVLKLFQYLIVPTTYMPYESTKKIKALRWFTCVTKM